MKDADMRVQMMERLEELVRFTAKRGNSQTMSFAAEVLEVLTKKRDELTAQLELELTERKERVAA